jgi:hypothetical protein
MPGSTLEQQRNRTLPEICMHVHMATTGASDPYDEYHNDIELLQWALEEWREGPAFKARFDDAVKNLIKVTVEEAQRLNPGY